MKNGIIFLLTTKYLSLYWETRLPKNPEYAEMRHGGVILTFQWRHGSTCDQRAANVQLFVFVFIPPQTLFVVGILFSRFPSVRASVRASVRPSVTLCFLNILKSHCWIFIKPCKHVHICKTKTLNKKVRARGQFY